MKGTPVRPVEWAAGVAARLRLLQASFADDPPEMREQTLREELEQALKAIALGQRKEYIEALATEFPEPESGKKNGTVENKTVPAKMPEDPVVLAEGLLNLMRAMPPEAREPIMAQFIAAGFLPASNGANLEASGELRERIQRLAPGQHLDHGRALRMLDVLIDFVWSLDQLVWQVWKGIAPKSLIRRETGKHSDFRKTLGPYLTGDAEVSTEQVKQLVNRTRMLVAGLMAAMGTLGQIHTQKFLERLSPDAIRKRAEADPGVFESIEKKCWRKYASVFAETSATMEKESLDAIKKYTERLVLGPDASKTLEE